MVKLHIRHIRQAGYCARAAREWFKRYDMNYTEFLQHGMDCEVFEKTGDHFALVVCRLAREEAASQQQEANNG